MSLTQLRLKELLHYDPVTGHFTWIVANSNRAPAGTPAGRTGNSHGYCPIGIDGKRYRAHRLAWLYMTGEWPPEHIDHINGVRSDNRWHNLRAATLKENNRNMGLQRNNAAGYKGVSKHGPTFRAECYADAQRVRKSGFPTPEAAAEWLTGIRDGMHGQFAQHGEFERQGAQE